ncbi:MAG: hypothetical protein APR62_10860 [Smithella sp. SDB]|nr:MAG: hypothetical protein APR62_10860 [Smithella sp. SDB]
MFFKRLIKTIVMKYLLNPDVLDSTSVWAVFVKRLCFKLMLIKGHITNYRDGFYQVNDLLAIIGYIPLKTHRLIDQSQGTILISALGFGEIVNSISLIRGIQTLSSYSIVIISRQPQLARQLTLSMGLSVVALPYPYQFCIWRPFISYWLNKLKPVSILCIENMIEIRADMLEMAKARHNTSVLLINAHAYRKSPFLWHILEETKDQNKRRFKCVDIAGVVSEEARKYLLGYGVSDSNIIMVNNLKFDTAKHPVKIEDNEKIRQQLGIPSDAQVLICGSVHPGEEAILLNAFRDVISRPGHLELKNIRLIIAPRELYTLDPIIKSIKSLGFSIALKTASPPISRDSHTIVIVDTIGELKAIYSIADVVIVAGSMLDHLIGHNPIEPAILGKPIIVGHYMSSFKDIMDKFLQRNAIIQLQNTEELADQVAILFEHPEIRERMGSLAKAVVDECSGATEKYLDILGRLLPK